MTDYITKSDLAKAFDERDFPQDNNGNDDEERISECIDFASTRVDSYLRTAGIETPINYESGISAIRPVMLDITWYRLQDHPSDTVKERYEQAMAWLKDVAKGLVKLPAPPSPGDQESTGSTGKSYGLTTIRMYRG